MEQHITGVRAMAELETFAAKFGQLRDLIDVVNDFVWREFMEWDHQGEAAGKLGALTEALAIVAHVREDELNAVIEDGQEA